jgi:hypothetical protein
MIMANEKTLEILKEIKADPKAKELFKGMEKPKSPDEAIAAYAQVAEKLGYGITAEDIREAVKQEETIRKAKTDKVVADMEELKDDDLEGVAGGYYHEDGCVETYSIFSSCDKVDYCFFSITYYECYDNYSS